MGYISQLSNDQNAKDFFRLNKHHFNILLLTQGMTNEFRRYTDIFDVYYFLNHIHLFPFQHKDTTDFDVDYPNLFQILHW